MPNTMISRQQGFSLVELMVSLVIGMIVISGATGVFIGTFGANATQMKTARLNSELRTVMTIITRDLKRAGFHNWSPTELADGDFTVSPQAAPVITSNSMQVAYDENADGTAGTTESYGFQFSNGTIQARIGSGGWTDLVDGSVIEITAFSITNISPTAIAPAGATSSVTVPVYSIQITGRLVSDPTVVRTLRETVRVRNVILS